MRRLALGIAVLATASGAAASPASAHSGCKFSATTTFTPALVSASQPFTYVLEGTITRCLPGGLVIPSDGAVTAGKAGVTIQGVTFDEPVPSGTGGCRDAAAGGTLWTVWQDGSVTIVDYETTGVAAALVLEGAVVPSKTVVGSDGETHTITTTRHLGEGTTAALVSRVADPTACSGAGIPSALLEGPVFLS